MPKAHHALALTLLLLLPLGACMKSEPDDAPAPQSTAETTADRNPASPPATEATGPATFAWEYEAFREDDYPKTRIELTVTHADGETETQTVDTVTGGCNGIDPDVGEALAPGSEKIQCYYAGVGHRYRVVETPDAYEVEREIFEEATPDYEPPPPEVETVATFAKR